jgi:methyl-accepting chemotaxis protein
VQNNAATSEESAAASEQLTSQASALKEAVSVFKLNSSYYADSRPVNALRGGSRTGQSAKPAKQKITLGSDDFGKY